MLIKERRKYELINTAFQALHYYDWLFYLKLDIIILHTRTLRSSKETTLLKLFRAKIRYFRSRVLFSKSGTFQYSASNVLNSLPSAVRNSVVFSGFKLK